MGYPNDSLRSALQGYLQGQEERLRADPMMGKLADHWLRDARNPTCECNVDAFAEGVLSRLSKSPSSPTQGLRILIKGDPGAGKTRLLQRLYLHLCSHGDVCVPGGILPYRLSLNNDALVYGPEIASILPRLQKVLSPEEIERLRSHLRPCHIGEFLTDELCRALRLEEARIKEIAPVFLVDGFHLLDDQGRQRLLQALHKDFAHASWIVATRPQATVDEKGWEIWELESITLERLPQYLAKMTGKLDGSFAEALRRYCEGLREPIRSTPRYLWAVVEMFQDPNVVVHELPTSAGRIFQRAFRRSLYKGLREENVHAAQRQDFVHTMERAVGCLGLFAVLAPERPLFWDGSPWQDNVHAYLQSFLPMGILPKSEFRALMRLVKARGPWGSGGERDVVFEHESTRHYAVAALIVWLLKDWPAGRHPGFRRWVHDVVHNHPNMAEVRSMVNDLLHQDDPEDANGMDETPRLPGIDVSWGKDWLAVAPEDWVEVLRTTWQLRQSPPQSHRAYRLVRYLRHEAKQGAEHFVEKLRTAMPSGEIAFQDPETRKPLLFSPGTYLLAKALAHRDGVPKEPIVTLFHTAVVQAESFDAPVLLSRLADQCRAHHNRRGLNWFVDTMCPFSEGRTNRWLLGDADFFRETLEQILKNAGDWAENTVRALVVLSPEKDPAFLVMDDGPGVSPDEVPGLFQATYTRRAERGGTGLGLTGQILETLERINWQLYVRDRQDTWWQIRWNDNERGPSAKPYDPEHAPWWQALRADLNLKGAVFVVAA